MADININESNFDSEVLAAELPVLVDFWATWCGPCKVLGPIVEELSNEFEGKLKVGKVDVDANNSLAMKYGVMSIPTLKFFKGGKVVGEVIGAAPKQAIIEEINKHI